MLSYEKTDDGIYVRAGFDITKTALSGQIFRYSETDGGFVIFSKDKKAVCLSCADGGSGILSNGYNNCEKPHNGIKIITKDSDYFINYFDLNKNYDIIEDRYRDNSVVSRAIEYSKGIRMLRQDCFETIISFIISANNNIPRIKKIIERLCKNSGKHIANDDFQAFTEPNAAKYLGENSGKYNSNDGFYAFPEPFDMRDLDENFYKSVGAGYRAAYLQKTVKMINDGFDLNRIFGMPTDDAQKYLMKLEGVGPKVADCILLFAYGKGGVFPVDTWIKKSAKELFGIDSDDIKKIRRELVGIFGEDSGIIQQYIYYYMRGQRDDG
jgi:N-glycosylase/DNA lyase